MVNLSSRTLARPARTPITATGVPSVTHEGAPAVEMDARSELFTLGASLMFGEPTFYESGDARAARCATLVTTMTATDPTWTADFLRWLRDPAGGGLRTAPIAGAVHYCLAGGPDRRALVRDVLRRADEPGEFIAYHKHLTGKTPSAGVQRGVADAAQRLYTEYAAIKYDGKGRAWRPGDVIDLAHPTPAGEAQSQLFRYLLDRRHDRTDGDYGLLPKVTARVALEETPQADRGRLRADNPQALAEAGFTWEQLSTFLGRALTGEEWAAIAPEMGYLALIRNLRNFDQANLPREAADTIAARIAAGSDRALPMQLFSSYTAVQTDRWKPALAEAMDKSVANIPTIRGRTAVLVDTSGSMSWGSVSARSNVKPVQLAMLFGIALTKANPDAELWQFADHLGQIQVDKSGSVTNLTAQAVALVGSVGHGTRLVESVDAMQQRGMDQIVVLTDMQAHPPSQVLNRWTAQVLAFNLNGYNAVPTTPQGPLMQFGAGLTDATWRALAAISARRDAGWPWQ